MSADGAERTRKFFAKRHVAKLQHNAAIYVVFTYVGVDAAHYLCRLTSMMKNLTLSVEEAILQQARRRAASENTTISDLVRSWLERYVAQPSAADQYLELMESLRHVEAGRKYTREEMNERR